MDTTNQVPSYLSALKSEDIRMLSSFGVPPPAVAEVSRAIVLLLTNGADSQTTDFHRQMGELCNYNADLLIEKMVKLDVKEITPRVKALLLSTVQSPTFNVDHIQMISNVCALLAKWVIEVAHKAYH